MTSQNYQYTRELESLHRARDDGNTTTRGNTHGNGRDRNESSATSDAQRTRGAIRMIMHPSSVRGQAARGSVVLHTSDSNANTNMQTTAHLTDWLETQGPALVNETQATGSHHGFTNNPHPLSLTRSSLAPALSAISHGYQAADDTQGPLHDHIPTSTSISPPPSISTSGTGRTNHFVTPGRFASDNGIRKARRGNNPKFLAAVTDRKYRERKKPASERPILRQGMNKETR